MLFAILFVAATAGKDIFFSSQKIREIPALMRATMMVVLGTFFVWPFLIWGYGTALAKVSFWGWIFIHPALMAGGIIHQMRSLSRGPISKTQPVIGLSLVLFTLCEELSSEKSIHWYGLIGALVTLIGIVISIRRDSQGTGREDARWQLTGTFDAKKALGDHTQRKPVPCDEKVEYLNLKDRWNKSGVFNSLIASLFLWMAIHVEVWCSKVSNKPTFVLFDLVVLSIYLCIILSLSQVQEKMGLAKVKEPSLLLQLFPGGILFAGIILLSGTVPFSLIPTCFGAPILCLCWWSYFLRKDRKFTALRMVGIGSVVCGSIMMITNFFPKG